MGLSIHYSGSFRKGASLSEMIEEVKDIISVYKWKYSVYEEEFPDETFSDSSYNQNIYGISFTPPGCETVSISFLSNGRMSSYPALKFFGKTENQQEQEYLYMLAVKTQYAGIEVHKLIIHLFKYLNEKYFQDFKVLDEGEYWESGDENLLQETFKRYTNLINSFTSAIENIPSNEGETLESYLKRLMSVIQNRKDK
ncbi:MAG: hypothetical protein H8E98_08320 [Bacteroidetes bacterium]|nr:hypothetical protein [Bacteroidota bacterium]